MTKTAILTLAILAVASPSSAQFGFGAFATPPQKLELPLAQALHTALDAYQQTFFPDPIINVLASQVTTFPIGTSSGAFTYTYDVATRTFRRRSATLGPYYAERATTVGRRHALEVGSATQFTTYGSLDGRRLDDNALFDYTHLADGTVSGRQFHVSLKQRVTTLFATYGLSNSVDVRVIVPVVRTTFHGVVKTPDGETFQGTFVRTSRPGARDFAGFTSAIADFGPVSDTGVGDIQGRAKWTVVGTPRFDVGAQVDLRIPTGDYFSLSGTKAWRQKMSALVSVRTGQLQHHANVGYTFRLTGATLLEAAVSTLDWEHEGATANEISYVGGTEWAPSPMLTVTAEIAGRILQDAVAFRRFVEDSPVDGGGAVATGIRVEPARLHQQLAAFGGKLVIFGSTLVSAHVLFSIDATGLTIKPTPVIGIEHAF